MAVPPFNQWYSTLPYSSMDLQRADNRRYATPEFQQQLRGVYDSFATPDASGRLPYGTMGLGVLPGQGAEDVPAIDAGGFFSGRDPYEMNGQKYARVGADPRETFASAPKEIQDYLRNSGVPEEQWGSFDETPGYLMPWDLYAGVGRIQQQLQAGDFSDIMSIVGPAIFAGGVGGIAAAGAGAAAAGAGGAAAEGGLSAELAAGAPELAGAYSLSSGTGAGALSAELSAGAPELAGTMGLDAGVSDLAPLTVADASGVGGTATDVTGGLLGGEEGASSIDGGVFSGDGGSLGGNVGGFSLGDLPPTPPTSLFSGGGGGSDTSSNWWGTDETMPQNREDFPGGGSGGGSTSMQSALDKVFKYGPLALGTAGALGQRSQAQKYAKEIGAIGGPQRALGQQLLSQYNSGTLSPADAARISQWEQGALAASRQYFARAGTTNSTQAKTSEQSIRAQAEAMRQQSLQSTLKLGLDALNVTDKYQAAAIEAEMRADQATMQNAFGFLSAYGSWLRALPQITGA